MEYNYFPTFAWLARVFPKENKSVRSQIGWGGEWSILYKSVETSPQQTRFKNLVGKTER